MEEREVNNRQLKAIQKKKVKTINTGSQRYTKFWTQGLKERNFVTNLQQYPKGTFFSKGNYPLGVPMVGGLILIKKGYPQGVSVQNYFTFKKNCFFQKRYHLFIYFKFVTENPFMFGNSFVKSLLKLETKLSPHLKFSCFSTISLPEFQ